MTEPVHGVPFTPPQSVATLVWRQFRQSWTHIAALVVIVLLAALAIYAPLISASQPLLWCADGQGCTSPWLRGLFFNRNVFESGIDLFFNLLIFFVPLSLLAHFLLGKVENLTGRKSLRKSGQTILTLGLFSFFFALLFWHPRQALPDYVAMADQARLAIFPPLRMQYSDVLFGAEGAGLQHLLGLDTSGRDVFVRMLFGARVSLAVGVIAVGIYMVVGVIMGSLAGFYGGWVDLLTERTVEIFLCFPALFLILTFISFLEKPSIVWVMVFIGIVGWTGPARLVRGEFLRLRSQDFVIAAQALGLSNTRIVFRHILPNALGPVLVSATFGIANAVIVEATLSFLGIGDPVLPSWGRILALGRSTGDNGMMLLAGALIFVTVSALNMAGEGLRDALDPRMRS